MKLIIGSDIHGSELHLKKFINAVEREKADKILLLGDLDPFDRGLNVCHFQSP